MFKKVECVGIELEKKVRIGRDKKASFHKTNTMCDMFISVRFGETLEEGQALKKGLASHGINALLRDVMAGESIVDQVVKNLMESSWKANWP